MYENKASFDSLIRQLHFGHKLLKLIHVCQHSSKPEMLHF